MIVSGGKSKKKKSWVLKVGMRMVLVWPEKNELKVEGVKKAEWCPMVRTYMAC